MSLSERSRDDDAAVSENVPGFHSGGDGGGPLELDCDVVVVGSGAGGAVVAAELAESGLRVLVLEEGPHVRGPALGAMRPSESMRRVWRDGAFSFALGLGDSPTINVTMGRCVGGSSVLTGGVCFRVPDSVLTHWTRVLGLDDYTPASMERYFTRVEERIHVEEVPESMRSQGVRLFAEGAKKLGFEVKPMSRNTIDCKGCGRCNFGCPHGAKRSVDLSYLPRAVEHGAEVFSDCLVERIVMKGTHAVGVEGYVLDARGKRTHELTVHARAVVVAAGAWHTPLLLRDSGLGNPEVVGRRLTLHPGFRVLARFDEPVRGWRGALQSAWSDAFEHEGVTLTSLFVPVGVLGATMPGIGPEHTEQAANIDHLAMFGGIIHDQGGGTVYRGLGREPIVTYRMSRKDRASVAKLVRTMAKTFFAAGAREVYLPILGLRGVDADGLANAPLETVPAQNLECASQHPLGSAQMGSTAEHSVVDGDGRVWGVDGLYIADGSVLPTSLGVNPQVSIMSVATRVAWRMRERHEV